MYVAEVSPPSLRGRMGTLYQLSIVAGGFTSYCINYLMRDIGPDNWRWMFITGVAPSALFFVMLLFARTPRYLVMIGKYETRSGSLHELRGRRVRISRCRKSKPASKPRGTLGVTLSNPEFDEWSQ